MYVKWKDIILNNIRQIDFNLTERDEKIERGINYFFCIISGRKHLSLLFNLILNRRSITNSNAETFILPFGRNPACISRASMSREGKRKHMAVQRCTKAAVGPPCLHKLFARPEKSWLSLCWKFFRGHTL